MPITLMKNRGLYRKRLRSVTFRENENLFHRTVTYSRKIRLPGRGERGQEYLRGEALSVDRDEGGEDAPPR